MRLVTRGDMEGLVSAVLITSMEDIGSLALIHPQDITDNKFEVREGDILVNKSPMRRHIFHAVFNSDVHAGQRVALSGTVDRQ